MPSNAPSCWLDGHLDLAYIALDRSPDAPSLDRVPDATRACISWPTLAAGGIRACLGTIFTEAGGPEHPCGYRDHEDRDGAHAAGRLQLELYEQWEREGRLVIARSIDDLDRGLRGEGPPAVALLMECADPIRSPEEAGWWAERGVCMVGLSWGAGSRYSGGNARAGGLTAEGRDLVAALDEAGVAHDVSHLADQSVEDLLDCARGPIASSHSNARSLLPDGRHAPRHLADDHAREIAARGGVAGINLFGRFLAEDRSATIDDVVDHAGELARHFTRQRVGLGSDMDGGFGPDLLPKGLEGPERLGALDAALIAAGWNEEDRGAFRTEAWLGFLAGVPSLAP
jgi:membrane dipeptidase